MFQAALFKEFHMQKNAPLSAEKGAFLNLKFKTFLIFRLAIKYNNSTVFTYFFK